jgi:hypothetical protein
MIAIEQLKALKKGNVSVNTGKSKVRIPEAFKKATTAQKDEIINLSGLSKFTFYGASKTGAASPRAVIALAQIMDISPFYLTGESDKKEPCDAAVLLEFFNKCSGNEKIPTKIKSPAKGKAAKAAPVKAVKKAAPVKSAKPKAEKAINIDDGSLIKLLEALAIRAKFGGDAEVTYNKVVQLLVK